MIADHAFPHWEPVTDLDMLGSGLVGKTFLSTCPVTFLVFSSSDISCSFFRESNVNLTIIFVSLCIRASSSLRNSPVNPSRTGYALMKHVPVLCEDLRLLGDR